MERRGDLRRTGEATTLIRNMVEEDGWRKREEGTCSSRRERRETGEDSRKGGLDSSGRKKPPARRGHWKTAD